MSKNLKSKTPKSPEPMDIFIGQALRLYREIAGLKQADLARKLGDTMSRPIFYQTIQAYELGVTRIPAGTLYNLVRILTFHYPSLNLSVSSFFEGYKEVNNIETIINNKKTELQKKHYF